MDTIVEFARKLAFINSPLPRRWRWCLFRLLIDLCFSAFMKRRFGLYYNRNVNCSTPPRDLFIKLGATTPEEFETAVDPRSGFEQAYYSLGRYTVLRFLQLIERHGGNVRNLGTVFELGCGSGRLTQHLLGVEGLRVIGSDLNPEMVAWCGEKFPGATFFSNGVEPPLPFLEDNSVDLVYCYSVFTHIPLELQTPWLQELRRVLRPGGFLICTVAGWRLQKQFVNSADAETLRMKGRLQYTSEDAAASLATQVGGSAWDVYQTRSEVVRVFGAVFALRDYLTIGQDVLVLQKEPVLERGKFLVMHPATYVLPSDPERPAQLNENGHTAPARLSEGDAP
jgi:SAM-dependent methyltransferase